MTKPTNNHGGSRKGAGRHSRKEEIKAYLLKLPLGAYTEAKAEAKKTGTSIRLVLLEWIDKGRK